MQNLNRYQKIALFIAIITLVSFVLGMPVAIARTDWLLFLNVVVGTVIELWLARIVWEFATPGKGVKQVSNDTELLEFLLSIVSNLSRLTPEEVARVLEPFEGQKFLRLLDLRNLSNQWQNDEVDTNG